MSIESDLNDIVQGDTKRYKITITDNAGDPVNIFNNHFWFTIKTEKTDSDANAIAQIEHIVGQDADDDAVNGLVYVTLPSDISKTVPVESYFFDFQRSIIATPPIVTTLRIGKVKFVEGITDDDE